ncbi:hypothetical protein LCGC14_3056210, partial [marine sediment metagenome]
MDTETRLNFNLENCGVYGVLTQNLAHAMIDRGLQELASFDITSEAKMDDVIAVINSNAIKKVYTHSPADDREKGQWQYKLFDMDSTI